MEFNFNVNNFFKDEITKVSSRLIPEGFVGDRREIQDCLSKVSYILNILGERSAKAQGLQKVITSGEKLRNSDHVVYVLVDPKGGSKGLGTVLGMLKTGIKHLYVFDAGGNNHEITTKCILDFYVHESKQRMGLGKKLFQHMLKEERVDPVHLAIDKPSSKFLSFLHKHYGLETIIPQMNNFVVFEGFFSNRPYGGTQGNDQILAAGLNSCGSPLSSGTSRRESSTSPTSPYSRRQSSSSINLNNNMSYYGRQAPHKPISTMGMILQQKPAPGQQPAASGREPTTPSRQQEVAPQETESPSQEPEKPPIEEHTSEEVAEEKVAEGNEVAETEQEANSPAEEEVPSKPEVESPNQCLPSPIIGPPEPPKEKPRSRLNSQGHLDLKFYHSSLW